MKGRLLAVMAVVLLYAGSGRTQGPGESPPIGVSAPVPDKLDLILDKLDRLDRRLSDIERRLAERPAPTCLGLADWVSSFFLSSIAGEGVRLNCYSSDPNRRMRELLKQSEDLRQIQEEWNRIWSTDQPSHLTPERVNGPIE